MVLTIYRRVNTFLLRVRSLLLSLHALYTTFQPPNAQCQISGSQPGAPASQSDHDGGPRARTCKQTWSLRRATWASNCRGRTLQPGDSERTKERPTTSAGTARRFSGARQQPASWCSGEDQVAADTSNEVRNASTT